MLENKVVQKAKLEKNGFFTKTPKLIFLNDFFFWKNSVDFWHRKLTLKVWLWHFLMNNNSLQDCFKKISFEHVDSWAKILHFKFHNWTADINTYSYFGYWKISVEILENKIKCYFKKKFTTFWIVYLWWPRPLLASVVQDWWYDRWQNSWSMSENRKWDFAPVSNRKRN